MGASGLWAVLIGLVSSGQSRAKKSRAEASLSHLAKPVGAHEEVTNTKERASVSLLVSKCRRSADAFLQGITERAYSPHAVTVSSLSRARDRASHAPHAPHARDPGAQESGHAR